MKISMIKRALSRVNNIFKRTDGNLKNFGDKLYSISKQENKTFDEIVDQFVKGQK